MSKSIIKTTFLLIFSFSTIFAQRPTKPSAVEIYNQIQKLNFLGSVLYVAAHPDDENTRLISYLANETKARTAYLSLTRGDGGQNLIGAQLRELLGVIRTQELIEARKIDGGEQFFSRANDFGFSKNPTETLAIWDKEKVLADVIWAIRKFQPDVIINRFDHRSPGTTHGHHTASAMLSVESFNLTNNPAIYPDQLKYVQPWQAKRQFFNTSWWFYGSQEKFNAADKTNLLAMQTGVYYPNIGKSNQEIAALSRSSHESQGFGSTGSRGEETEYLEFLNGEKIPTNGSLFDGIDTSWNRVKGGKAIGEILQIISKEFNHNNPSASIPKLVKAYQMMLQLDENHWSKQKAVATQNIIAACAGLYLEAVAPTQQTTPGSNLKVKIEAINRSAIPMVLKSVTTLPNQNTMVQNSKLDTNQSNTLTLDFQLPETIAYTQPYWLAEEANVGMYTVSNPTEIGLPEKERDAKVVFTVSIEGVEIPFERTVVYKYNDDVKGEMYNFLDIVPEATSTFTEKVLLFTNEKSKNVGVKVKAGKDAVKGIVQLELGKDWKINPAFIEVNLETKGSEKTVYFTVTPPKNYQEIVAKSTIVIGEKRLTKSQIIIDFDHITKQQILKNAEAKFIRMDLKINNEKIAYIMGAGDEVPASLEQMGYHVTLLKPEEITTERMASFDVVMTGVRAYNTVQALANKQSVLFDFVKEGKTMIVQYNTLDDLVTQNMAPYPLKISRDRVTEENAEVRFLAPNHPILHFPNKITTADFKGWKQEQGLYYPNTFDAAFTPILSSNDKGETPKNGALLVAPYGKGNYIYTGLSFFRELPEGVSGAFKLLSNAISLQSETKIPDPKINH
ncbi:PIG-L family deacetylase [Flavobacterium sp. TSSA_36]|uniref:PIG-L family deacetylase n=1 Tax=Flavobacterium sp. TSSA_36 TaxID=3447669 RepID=UPI003F3DE3BD